jgi:hypothetical protein
LEKQRTRDRLEHRRREIEGRLFDALRKNPNAKSARPPVWVHGKVLLQYLSCSDGMDDVLSRRPLLQHRPLVCSHGKGGLHPRVARSGKLLPRHIYDTIVSLLSDEKDQLVSNINGKVANSPSKQGKRQSAGEQDYNDGTADLIIAPDSSLFCMECVETYRKELAAKERALSLILNLHADFEDKRNDLDPKALPEGQDIFAVSRHFVTVFKKHAEKVMKEASSPRVVCEGIDLLDLSFLPSFQTEVKTEEPILSSGSDCMIIEKDESAVDAGPPVGEQLDPNVNGKISCEHGRSNVLKHKKSARYVPAQVWTKLVQLFPEAIPFRRFRRRSDDDNQEVEELCNDEAFDGKCIYCEVEKAGSSEMLEKLQEWGQHVISRPYVIPPKYTGEMTRYTKLQELYSFRSSPEMPIRKTENIKCLSYRIVYRENVQAWRSAVDVAQSLLRSKKKGAGVEAKEKIIALAPWAIKSILCEHNCVPLIKTDIDKLVIGALSGSTKISNFYNKELFRQIEIMSSDEHSAYVETLKDLHSIIFPGGKANNSGTQEVLSMAALQSYHPRFMFGVENVVNTKSPQDQSTRVLLPQGTLYRPAPFLGQSPSPSAIKTSRPVWVKSIPEPCQCNVCLDGFVAAALALGPSPMKASAQDIELVDPQNDGQVDIKVHELGGSVELDAALSVLSTEINRVLTAVNGAEDREMGSRRSSRKRKTRMDGITTHEFRLFPHDNLAKLKLLLLERANKVHRPD